jgi:hypothetical protein
MKKILFILIGLVLLAHPVSSETLSGWNGTTIGTSTGNMNAWNGGTLGTASGNVNAINGASVPATTYSWGSAPAANNVWYSASIETADLKTGSPYITIASGGKATITTSDGTTLLSQTGNLGIGDCILANSIKYYIAKLDDNSSGFSHCYITTATGAAPSTISATAITSITHSFASLNAAMGFTGASYLNSTNLVTSTMSVNICCYYSSTHAADTAKATVPALTGNATYHLNIFTPSGGTQSVNSQRHSGIWNDNAYKLIVSDSCLDASTNTADYTVIDGLGIENDGTATFSCGIASQSNINDVVKNNIVRCGSQTVSAPIGILGTFIGGCYNNIVYGFTGGSNNNGAGINSQNPPSTTATRLWNNTCYGNYSGLNYTCTVTHTFYYQNNVFHSNTTDVVGNTGGTIVSTYNKLTADQAASSMFMGPTSTPPDFRLKDTSSVLYHTGTNYSAYGDSTDIVGNSRGSTWDIGAWQNY